MPVTFRCCQLKRSKGARKRCINLISPKYSVIVAEKKGFSSRNYLGLFLVALGSKPPLATRIARTGLGTRLGYGIILRNVIYAEWKKEIKLKSAPFFGGNQFAKAANFIREGMFFIGGGEGGWAGSSDGRVLTKFFTNWGGSNLLYFQPGEGHSFFIYQKTIFSQLT